MSIRSSAETCSFSSSCSAVPYLMPRPQKRKQRTCNGVSTGKELSSVEQLVDSSERRGAQLRWTKNNEIVLCEVVEPGGAQWQPPRQRCRRRRSPAPPARHRRRGRTPSTRRNAETNARNARGMTPRSLAGLSSDAKQRSCSRGGNQGGEGLRAGRRALGGRRRRRGRS